TADVPASQWQNKNELSLSPIAIPAFYWGWWRRWCRNFTVRGRVLCANGSPVPGAVVCAYDVDWWWWWISEDQVGCATTDATGSFEINFRWCCGWWPWWWWSRRYWQLEPNLAERILNVMHRSPALAELPVPTPKPDLSIFTGLAGRQASPIATRAAAQLLPAVRQSGVAAPIDPGSLAGLRDKIAPRLPAAAELEKLHLWPWFPWEPWLDCNPDLIFRVTQNCGGVESVIVQENVFNVREDVPTTLDVTLVANDCACCVQQPRPDPQGDCALLFGVCSETNPADQTINIGGNFGAPPVPAGYQNPGGPGATGDRPYAGTVSIFGQFGLGATVDYYEFEYSGDNGATWNALPPGASAAPARLYFGPPLFAEPIFPPVRATPPTFAPINGRRVCESRTHFEAAHGAGTWGLTHFWTSDWSELAYWITSPTTFSDGTYRLRARTWTAANLAAYVAGDDPTPLSTILSICDTKPKVDNFLVLTIDNRLDPDPSHPTANHACGAGTVHECTREPDTHFISVKLVQGGLPDIDLKACSIRAMRPNDNLQVDFFVHDPDGHLAVYELYATYGDSLRSEVLAHAVPGVSLLGGAPYAAVPTPLVIPSAGSQVGPDYGLARAQGAVAPIWTAGTVRLTVPAALVFPEPCCYQLVLAGYKRTLTCGDEGFIHSNLSEYSFMITF
ncbi:MAG: carboxypeptidase-like regulatory domain-containing protein, partial [Bryobacteraceae bacterium]